jgi:hypothetical protein
MVHHRSDKLAVMVKILRVDGLALSRAVDARH